MADIGSIQAYTLSYGPHAGEKRPFLVTGKADGKDGPVYEGLLFANPSDDPDGGPAVYAAGPVHRAGVREGSEGTDVLSSLGGGEKPQPQPQPDPGPQPPPVPGAPTRQAHEVRPGAQLAAEREGEHFVPQSPADSSDDGAPARASARRATNDADAGTPNAGPF